MLKETKQWHALEENAVITELESGQDGLSPEEVSRRRQLHGDNILPSGGEESAWRMLWRQFNNPIGWLLLAAGVLSLFLARYTDAAVVFAAVVINALLGFIQEFRAGKAIASLAALVPESALVLRDGRKVIAPACELVPGDVVIMQSGDKVPADLRLLRTKNLLVQESALTGESFPVAKATSAVGEDAPLGDRSCMTYSGTMVLQGTGTGVVVATGERTELGKISLLLRRTKRLETPLTRQLAKVSSGITMAVVLVVAVLVVFGIWIKDAPVGEALMVAVTLAVAAIPEGLPAVITIAMAVGVRRMAERRAVVRYLPAVETLGATTVICSDKTGTLTRNEMTVQVAWVDDQEYRFAGVGYAPVGEVEYNGSCLEEVPAGLGELLDIAVLCNDASLHADGDIWTITGDPTEAALVVAAAKAGIDATELRSASPRRDVLPFESERKFMATLNLVAGTSRTLLKGAPEKVLRHCALTADENERLVDVMETFARQGLRVIACACREGDQIASLEHGDLAHDFTFNGFLGMVDPPRTEAMDAIRICRAAGIEVKMITGDHPVTAEAIGRQLGLLHSGQSALQGSDLERMDDAELQRALGATSVIARVAPEHKLRIVEALQSLGQVVAMTGDGVNDAPALKRADIGIAMGITGTDVSRDAAKVVLVDDNFASIAAAVEEGRRVYDNLIKSLAFILPTNLGLALTLSGAMFFFPTVPVEGINELLLAMSPSQTLWINLVASVTLSIPLAFEVLEPGVMLLAPRPVNAPVFSRFLVIRVVLVALLLAAGACGLFLWEYFRITGSGPTTRTIHHAALSEAQTVCVTSITFTQAFYLLNCRSLRRSIFSQGVLSNPSVFVGIVVLLLLQACFIYLPPLQHLFGSAPLGLRGWLDALLVGSLVLPVIFVEKWVMGRE
ncbi:MAG TPA: HAD-IC family P-type ATPase [Geobacteraceae bacterium]|nr:HAD-IC family P-type ATPase [Geobacteraceae bacterium]